MKDRDADDLPEEARRVEAAIDADLAHVPHAFPVLGPTNPKALILALLIGGGGGAAFFFAGLPLPWMMGAAVFATVAALSGARIGVWPPLRQVMLVVLGVMLGSAFSPGLIDAIPHWIGSICALIVLTFSSGFLIYLFFRHVAGFDRVTSYFCGIPGGLAEMVAIGGAMGGDDRKISLAHAVRILTVVMTIPIWFRFHEGVRATAGSGVHFGDPALLDYGILIACGVIGAPLAMLVRLPAAAILGPMLLSAAAHYFGLTRTQPPVELVAAAQVVIGTAIGCRFLGVHVREVGRTLVMAAGGGILGVGMAVAFTFACVQFMDLPTPALLLSFSPGGVAEMSLVALALHIDTAMVAAHHLFRIFFVVLAAPAVFRLWVRLRPLPATPSRSARRRRPRRGR
ncbi:MAG: AbrB family transcriptional regulator [Reyranellaceae bacterium]